VTLGLFLSLLVILVCRVLMGPKFEAWGWRIPFLISLVLLGIFVYIHLSPMPSVSHTICLNTFPGNDTCHSGTTLTKAACGIQAVASVSIALVCLVRVTLIKMG
jgi:hypothetical protein